MMIYADYEREFRSAFNIRGELTEPQQMKLEGYILKREVQQGRLTRLGCREINDLYKFNKFIAIGYSIANGQKLSPIPVNF